MSADPIANALKCQQGLPKLPLTPDFPHNILGYCDNLVVSQSGNPVALPCRDLNGPDQRVLLYGLLLTMNPGLASSAEAKMKTATIPVARKRRLLWVISAVLALLLAGILTLAFSLGGDDSATTVVAAPLASAAPVATAGSAADTADSGEIVVDHPPGPRPREISGVAVDADGNSLDPNLVGPGDDSPFQKDDDKNGDDSKGN